MLNNLILFAIVTLPLGGHVENQWLRVPIAPLV
jgi:hypothetical protein